MNNIEQNLIDLQNITYYYCDFDLALNKNIIVIQVYAIINK